ncbi:hypothetical protein ACF1BQ_037355 [Bradyrhizobium sp. RDT10]
MSAPLRWYDHNADNPPWIKALAEVRIRATREGWCHASKKGSQTPKRDIEVIKARLKVAEAHYQEHYGKGAKK